jgi:hypothetical protein
VIRVRASVSLCVFKTGFGSGRASEDEEEKRQRWGAALAVLRLPFLDSVALRC